MENTSLGDQGGQPAGQSPYALKFGEAKQGNGNIVTAEKDNSAMHFFLYLVSFLSLWFVAMGLGTILYQIINKIFPDTGAFSYLDVFQQGVIKFGLASIIIATPIYYILAFLITKYLYEGKISEDSKVRKWTTYIILFFAAATIIGDLITLVYNLLGGDMAARFVLKVLVVILIAGSILGYYFWDMRKRNMVGVKYLSSRIFGGVSAAIILIVFVSSFFIIDTPAQTRNKQIDAQTVSSMQSLTYSIQSYADAHKELPATLDAIGVDRSTFNSPQSNSTVNPITYNKLSDSSYNLCANFNSSNMTDNVPTSDVYQLSDYSWKHDKGNVCFTKNITPKPVPASVNPNYQAPVPPSENSAEAHRKAYVAAIQAAMSADSTAASICRNRKGEVLSGEQGGLICKLNENIGSWPFLSFCGSDPSDSKWTVFNGNTDNWNFTLNCANFSDCNGPANAICSLGGCKFQGTCQ